MDEALLDEPELLAPAEHSQEESLFGEPVTPGPRSEAPLALYRRYRPDTFVDVIGQDHVTAPLQRALTNNRVNHAYLFSGPRGCGKTTSARILARALNCELGPIAEPCGRCQSCRDLARGGSGSIDVIEIDAASHGGVDDARDLRERAFFSPVNSRYKIYIVDEAHMVSPAGFNALLKVVEEPPPHVKFIFATTEPDKVIGTIRSRTHHYPFRLVPPRLLSDYLAKLCAAEGIAVEPAVLPLVVRAGAGSVRDSLSVLDQLLGGAEESGVTYRHATALLGYTPDSLLDEFMDAFAAGDAGGVFACVDKVIEVGQDPRRFAEDLLRRLRDLVIVAAVPDATTSGLVEVAGDQAERLTLQSAALGAGELTRAAEVIAVGLTEMRGTTAPRLHLELMCARVLLPGADVGDRGLHARLDRIERRLGVVDSSAPTAAPAPLAPAAPRPASTPEPAPDAGRTTGGSGSSTPPDAELPEPSGPDESSEPPAVEQRVAAAEPVSRPERPPTPARPELATTMPEPDEPDEPDEFDGPDERGPAGGETDDTSLDADPDPPATTGRPSLSVTDVRRLWPEVLEEVKNKRRFTWMLLSQNAQVAELRNNTLLLSMANVGARDHFSRGGSEDVLKDAIVVVLGADFSIETIVDTGSGGGALTGRVEPDRPADPFARPSVAQPGRPTQPGQPLQRAQPDSGALAPPSPTAAPAPSSPAAESRPDPAPAPIDPALRSQVRQGIRPTRAAGDGPNADDRDAAARRDDSDLDETAESHTELLARHLGAEIIAEEEGGA